MLLTQPLERLMLSDLHARAHVAVAVHEEGESAGQVFAAVNESKTKEESGGLERYVFIPWATTTT